MRETVTEGLRDDDPGVLMLARALSGAAPNDVLLVCCGDLPGVRVGATRVVLDVREEQRTRSRTVRASDVEGLAALRGFTQAAVWPRAHLGKDFTFACLAIGAGALAPGGSLLCSVRKAKGAESVADEMAALLGNVETVERDSGYRLLRSVRESTFDAALAHARTSVRHEIRDAVLGDVVLHSAPGVFSRKALDDGTRALVEHVSAWAQQASAPRAVIDLCAGIGPLGIWAARRWPDAQVLAVESNVVAAALAERNAADAGVGSRVQVHMGDGIPSDAHRVRPGEVDVALVNPPTHADKDDLAGLFAPLRRWMAPGGSAFVVVSRAGVSTRGLEAAGARVVEHRAAGYAILHAQW
jgi:16S rRNA G1207 methylase RsmC